MVDGAILSSEDYRISIEPHESSFIELPFDLPNSCKYGLYLNVQLYDENDKEIGMRQHKLNCQIIPVAPAFRFPLLRQMLQSKRVAMAFRTPLTSIMVVWKAS